MAHVTADTVRAYFDAEIGGGRRLLPDRSTVGGLGTSRKYEHAAALMADPAVRDVLDVGCNRGSIEALFHTLHPDAARDTRVEGVDVAGQAVAQAQALGLPNCRFQTYEGTTLPFPDASFDLVIMVEVLEHVIDKTRLLREIHRVLRPGGRFYLTTPNPECVALRIELGMWDVLRRVFRKPLPAKDAFITRGELSAMLETIGFRPATPQRYAWPHVFVSVWNWGVLPPLPPAWLYRYQQFCIARLEREGVPEWLQRRLMWTLTGELRKS
ncbi:MAG: methyltransferase domain-containing protein [Gemmatimonadaceae bacterium]|nr:methyltransferase domain-containing protein [Gemmatimonadaceae bacterium]